MQVGGQWDGGARSHMWYQSHGRRPGIERKDEEKYFDTLEDKLRPSTEKKKRNTGYQI